MRFRFTENDNSYNLSLYEFSPRQKQHILIILQTVDSRDLEARELLSSEVMPTFRNTLQYALDYARRIDSSADSFSFTVVNFNDYKSLHLTSDLQAEANLSFARRVHRIVQKIKPTKVLISGDTAFKSMHPEVENPQLKRGWVHDCKYGKRTIPTTLTLDFARLLEHEGLNGNLLGFFCRHLANLVVGYHPYSVSHVKPKYRYVDTDQKFKAFLNKLRVTKRVAVDTETKNLSVNFNQIYMIQFCMEEEPNVAYIIPLRHPTTPLTKKQQVQWSRQLAQFFAGSRKFFRRPFKGKAHPHHRIQTIADESELPEIITFNGNYDLRVIRVCLNVQIIPHYVYEIRAGEHALDENASALKMFGTRSGGLAYVASYYGNDFYQLASFSKDDRVTCGSRSPNDPGLLRYCAMDVLLLGPIRKGQIKAASHQYIGQQNFKPYFLRHVRHIMGSTEHQLSRLRECGSPVDMDYLKELTGSNSPLLKELQVLDRELRTYPAVQEANKNLVGNVGYQGYGLWGNKAHTWLFTPSKPAHRIELFLNVLGLEPVSFTNTGAPSINVEFIDAYKTNVSEVQSYADYQELAKLHDTYVKGWVKRLRTTLDGTHDYALRPDYSYMSVATGRLASYNPSLQVIPSRAKSAELIKRSFTSRPKKAKSGKLKGRLSLDYDFSAHEVRVWSIVSLDKALAAAFRVGQKLRQKYIMDPTPENKEAIKLHGDIHIANVKRLLNRIIDKSHPLRYAIKAIVFGAIYGKSAKSLGEDTKIPDINERRAKITALYKELEELG